MNAAIPTGPVETEPFAHGPAPLTARTVTEALTAGGLELGAYDQRIATWLAGWDNGTILTILSWVARAAARDTDTTAAVTTRAALVRELRHLVGAHADIVANDLHASGVVVDVATLAADEALVDRVARAMLYRWPADEPVTQGDRDQARRALTALATALTERAS